jgi:hypothetical protein
MENTNFFKKGITEIAKRHFIFLNNNVRPFERIREPKRSSGARLVGRVQNSNTSAPTAWQNPAKL